MGAGSVQWGRGGGVGVSPLAPFCLRKKFISKFSHSAKRGACSQSRNFIVISTKTKSKMTKMSTVGAKKISMFLRFISSPCIEISFKSSPKMLLRTFFSQSPSVLFPFCIRKNCQKKQCFVDLGLVYVYFIIFHLFSYSLFYFYYSSGRR